MKKTIVIKKTKIKEKIIFYIQPLSFNKIKKFSNIQQAENYPLIYELFKLPFIKTIILKKNCIILESFNNIEWDFLQKEVAEQIESFFDNGGEIYKKEKNKIENPPISVYSEMTPNPLVMKFVVNKLLTEIPIEFRNKEEAQKAPLIKKLFQFSFIESIFVDKNYISITKKSYQKWDAILLEIREFIKTYIEREGDTSIQKNKKEGIEQKKKFGNIEKKIVAILDEYIKPVIEADGGNIILKSYEKETKTVNVILQGACSGCPSSTITLKNGIENMLKDILKDKVESVNAINQ